MHMSKGDVMKKALCESEAPVPMEDVVGSNDASMPPSYVDAMQIDMGSPSYVITQQPSVAAPRTLSQHHSEGPCGMHILLSCIVFWLINWPCGLVAFIFACMAGDASLRGYESKARNYRIASIFFNALGVLFTIMILYIYFTRYH